MKHTYFKNYYLCLLVLVFFQSFYGQVTFPYDFEGANPFTGSGYSKTGPTLVIASNMQDAINFSNSKNVNFSYTPSSGNLYTNRYYLAIVNNNDSYPIIETYTNILTSKIVHYTKPDDPAPNYYRNQTRHKYINEATQLFTRYNCQHIIILEGEYEVYEPITLHNSNVFSNQDASSLGIGKITIEGEGYGTRIKNADTYDGVIFEVNSFAISIKNLSILTTNNNTGILIRPALVGDGTKFYDPRNNVFENLYIGTADMVNASSAGSGSISNSPTIPSSNVRTGISIREKNGSIAREIAFNRFKNITFNGLQIGLELVANTRLNHNYFENLNFNNVTVGVDFINQGSVGTDAHSDNVFSKLNFSGTSNLFRNIRGRHNTISDLYASGGAITIMEQAQHTTIKNATIPKTSIQDAGRYTQLINLSTPEGEEINYTLGNSRTYGTPSTTALLGSIKLSACDENGLTTIPTNTNTTPNYYLRCDAEGNAYWSILEPDLDARAWDQSATNNIKMDAFAITNNLNSSNGLFFNANGNVKIGSTVPNITDGNLQVDGNLAFRIYNNHGTILTNDDTWDNNFVVKNGKTIIGNSTENYLDQVATFDDTYKLFVNGKMRIKEELRINQTALSWPDYVFASDYKLMPLEKIEQHIQQKGHLPNMPNAAEVEQTGVPLATMITKQHEKIEELTLHLIEIQKEIDTLKQKQKNK